MAEDWPFEDPPGSEVFVCRRVLRGESSFLLVTRDADDGSWQFLDGEDIKVQDDATRVALDFVARFDPSLREIASLEKGWIAWRESATGPWRTAPEGDPSRDLVRENIAKFGWHVVLVPEDAEGPGFAYSIGMTPTFGHPEFVVIGLKLEFMHTMINTLGTMVRGGRRFGTDDRVDEVLRGYPVRLGMVDRIYYADYFGYGQTYQGGPGFEVLQCVWPDMEGRFPGDPGTPPSFLAAQPTLDRPPS